MLSLVAMSEFIATSFGQTLSGLLGPTFGWQSPFLICSPFSLFLLILIQLIVKEPERENSQDSNHMNCMDLFGKSIFFLFFSVFRYLNFYL